MGILLNSRSKSSPSHPREPRQPSSFASSSSSASQTSQSPPPSSNESEGPSRKIRFAPLPAPRRADLPNVFDESDSDSQLHSGLTSSDSYPQQPPSPRASSISTLHSDDTVTKSKSRTWGQKLLRPLLHPLLPSTTTNGEESYSALFRISSRETTKSSADPSNDSYKGGVPLARRMSTGSRAIPSTKEAERSHVYSDGVPLTPVMSEGFANKGRKDGQRMLNGRVYGRRLSASQDDKASYEPEFVEWGYGGMGSVANNQVKSRSGPDWAKLQSKGKVLGMGDDVDEEGDGGSGMGWVKRRRAQREREEREKLEREKAKSDLAIPDNDAHSPESKDSMDCPRASLRREDSDQSQGEEHDIYRASIPAPHHHHVRHHSHHKPGDGSGSATPTSAPSLSRANSSSSVPLIRTASSGSHGETLPSMPERKEDAEISSGSSETSSTSIDEDDEDEDENDTERESDDDEDDDVEGRITSRCAGVEKISRHKE